jgi:hypothetical protein
LHIWTHVVAADDSPGDRRTRGTTGSERPVAAALAVGTRADGRQPGAASTQVNSAEGEISIQIRIRLKWNGELDLGRRPPIVMRNLLIAALGSHLIDLGDGSDTTERVTAFCHGAGDGRVYCATDAAAVVCVSERDWRVRRPRVPHACARHPSHRIAWHRAVCAHAAALGCRPLRR